MPSIKTDLDALRECLQQETDLVTRFVTLLEQEAEVLAAGAAHDALTPITEKKNNYAEKLDQQTGKRNSILNKLGYGTDKVGLEAIIGDYSELYEPIRQLLTQTAQASILNTGNGRIIARFLNQNQQALDMLQHLTGRSDLYDASGHKHPTSRPAAHHLKVTQA